MKPSTQRRRIVFVLGRLKTGGNETAALQLLARLDRSRFDASVTVLSGETDLISGEFQALGIPIEYCWFSRKMPLGFVWRLARQLRRRRPDAVLCFSYSAMHLWIHLGARIANVPQRVTRVASWFDWKEPQLHRLQRYSTLVCNQEVAVSEYVGQRLRETGHLPARGIMVIPNGCDVDNIGARAAAERRSRPNDGARHVVMVSRLEEAKDHATLLKAFAVVVKQFPSTRLRLVGEGPTRPMLAALAKDLGISASVEFLGLRRDIPEVLGQNDIFAFSTRTEGFPNVLIEAMAAGLPVVSSDIPPCAEILDAGRSGILTRAGDAAAMAKAILALLASPEYLAKTANSGHQRVASCYRLEQMLHMYEHLLMSHDSH